jgi:riboflavin synthase
MFTGLIQDLGMVKEVSGGKPRRLTISTALPAETFALGESIALNGVCLTVVEKGLGRFAVEAGDETLAVTTVGSWQVGRQVNLERALALGDRLGGHLVLGHVDGMGRVRTSHAEQGSWLLEVDAPPEVEPFLLPKGSVALEGVSLTLNALRGSTFSVGLIPETLRRTTLGKLAPGDTVNLEGDILGKYVAKLLHRAAPVSSVTLEGLKAAGFA